MSAQLLPQLIALGLGEPLCDREPAAHGRFAFREDDQGALVGVCRTLPVVQPTVLGADTRRAATRQSKHSGANPLKFRTALRFGSIVFVERRH